MRYHNEPNVCKFACYLWNIYDQYSSPNFKDIYFEDADNDDFGSTNRTFEVMRNTINGSQSGFNNQFKSGLQADEMTSVQKIFDDMYISSSTKMLPPQVKDDASATLVNSSSINFAWTSQAYEYWAPYKNLEENYRIYKQTATGNQWVLCATIPSSIYYYTYSYAYSGSNVDKYNYKLTSSNSSGDACHSKIFNFDADPQLIVDISGPGVLNEPTTGYYSASVSGGNGTNAYHWFISYDGGGTWISKGTNSTFHFIPNWSERNATVRIDVVSGLQTVIATQDVDLNCLGCGLKSITMPADKFNVYPNPASDKVSFDYQENANIRIYNLTGKVVDSYSNFSGNCLCLTDLQSGFYLITVTTTNGNIKRDRFSVVK
jgi:hypothetical protein